MEDYMEDRASRTHARGAAWAVLAFAGSTMVSFNIWHALHGGIPQLPLAVLAGVVPVALAMGMSHIVAAYRAGRFLKVVTFAVMVGAMVLSVRATGYVVRPAFGPLWWLYGAVVDSAALVALQVILTPAEAANSATEDAVTEAAAVPPAEPPRVPSAGPRQSAARIDKSHEAEQGRAAYRRSARTGQPLSDRALGDMFGKSRTWGASRIREAEAGPHPIAAAR